MTRPINEIDFPVISRLYLFNSRYDGVEVAFRFRWFRFCHCERSVAISLA